MTFQHRLPAQTGTGTPESDDFGPPFDRPMTEDERRGFNWACEALQVWGHQIVKNGFRTGGATAPVPLHEAMAHGGRMVTACAEALQLTLGGAGRHHGT